jgi:hypothetical protein
MTFFTQEKGTWQSSYVPGFWNFEVSRSSEMAFAESSLAISWL